MRVGLGNISPFLHMLVCSVRRSPLPQNPRIFRRDRNAGAARYQARRIVGAGQLANTPHLLQSRLSASGAVGVELYAHRIRIDFAEVQLDFKYMPVARGLDLQYAEVYRVPVLVERTLPVGYCRADLALGGSPLKVGRRPRQVVSLGVFAHRAVGGKPRCQSRHALPHAGDPGVGGAFFLRWGEVW